MNDFERLIAFISKFPGLGPRSARRIALHLLKNRHNVLQPFMQTLERTAKNFDFCKTCGYLDQYNPCKFCTNTQRSPSSLCVVGDVADVWTFERVGFFKGRYHVLKGLLSASLNHTPETLEIDSLLKRFNADLEEVILALSATLEGQATALYIADRIRHYHGDAIRVSILARGIPFGSDLGYLDDGTLLTAFSGRQKLNHHASDD